MEFTKEDKQNIQETHDSVIKIEGHLQTLNGTVERLESHQSELEQDLEENKVRTQNFINKFIGAGIVIGVVGGLSGVLAILQMTIGIW